MGSVRDHHGRGPRSGRSAPPPGHRVAFVALAVASLIWVGIGYLSAEYALMAQNVVITLINLFGIYRWLIWKGKI